MTDESSLRTIGVAFSPDGRLLVTGATDGKVTFWDARTLKPFGPPTVGAGVVQPVSFSADSRVLATSSDDRTVRLYDVASRQQIGVPFPKTSQYGNASLSPDGHTLVTSGERGLVFWDVDPRSWARRACATAGRNLTREEWKRFLPSRWPLPQNLPAMAPRLTSGADNGPTERASTAHRSVRGASSCQIHHSYGGVWG